jgi:pimeloyl-ACP methyl ester carboxylesterase
MPCQPHENRLKSLPDGHSSDRSILYLHGFASSPASTKARFFEDRLTRAGFAVEIPDLADDFEHLTITGQLEVIGRAAGGEPVTLIGSSMGGYLAALYAARHLEVRRIALMAPAFGFARRWPERLGAAAVEEWKRTGALEVFHFGAGRTREVGYDLLRDGAAYEDYPEVTQPCLIFHGIHDDVVPAQYSKDFAAGRANVRLELMDSGHDLLNVLDEMADGVEAFFGSV